MGHEVIFDANVVVRNQAILDFKKYWFYIVGILDLVKGRRGRGKGGGGNPWFAGTLEGPNIRVKQSGLNHSVNASSH